MKALAELLSGMGCRVTGSDLQQPGPAIQAMQRRGLSVHRGHDGRFVPQDVDVVVYSPAVTPDNPERKLASELGIRQLSYSQMLGRLMRDRIGVCIAGTHGKSTTTAMTASILADSGLSPSAVIGAELCGCRLSGWAGEGPHFVVESCEYQRHFLDLVPRYATILGIEPDHFDYFREFEETQAAFAEFAGRVAPGGLLLIRSGCEASARAARMSAAEIETFGTDPSADWWAADLRSTAGGMRFRIFHRGQYVTEVILQTPGRHNVLNALAAAALAHRLGVPAGDVRESLQEFQGIRRRFEYVGSWRGVTLIDDFAHHPTEVRATLKTAREKFGRRRIWCAFQPHQVSRTRHLLAEFAESFLQADEVLVLPIYAAREAGGESAVSTAQELAGRIADHVPQTRFTPSLDQLVATLEDEARPGDVLITMGAGDIDRVQHEFTRRVQRHHFAG